MSFLSTGLMTVSFRAVSSLEVPLKVLAATLGDFHRRHKNVVVIVLDD